jgi:SnoaL-like domain
MVIADPSHSNYEGEQPMTDLSALVDDYLNAWNERDPVARRALVDKLWASDGVYTDPLASARGSAAIDQVIAGAQEQFPGMRFVRGDVFEAHHNIARFTWELVAADGGEPVVVGFDVTVLDADDKIAGLYGFIDKMPG